MRVVIVSNRLPVVLERRNDAWTTRGGSGGLVTAAAPVLQRLGGAWIGWPGAGGADEAELERVLALHSSSAGYELKPVPISQSEVEGFYQGFCNEIIWPLLHDLQSRCNFVPDYWTNYVSVKQKLLMSRKQRRPAMRRLRNIVRTQDVYWWVKRFLGACGVVAGPHAGATLMLSEFAPAGRDDATPRAEASA